jgi:hypothetical protein
MAINDFDIHKVTADAKARAHVAEALERAAKALRDGAAPGGAVSLKPGSVDQFEASFKPGKMPDDPKNSKVGIIIVRVGEANGAGGADA